MPRAGTVQHGARSGDSPEIPRAEPRDAPIRCALRCATVGCAFIHFACAEETHRPPIQFQLEDWSTRAMLRLQPEWMRVAKDSENRIRIHGSLEADIPLGEKVGVTAGWTTARRGDPRVPDFLYDNGALRHATIRAAPLSLNWRSSERPDISTVLGSMRPPWWSVENLVFDPDWCPIGVAAIGDLRYEVLRTRGVASVVSLADMGRPDWRLYTAQATIQWMPIREWRLTGGLSAFVHERAEGERPLRSDLTTEGNTLRPCDQLPRGCGRLSTDYHVWEGFAQIVWDPWLPVTLSAQYVVNSAASSHREGWLVGVALGRTRAVGGWELGWNYRVLQADATVSALADSEFGGGGTGIEGRRGYLRVHPVPSLWIAASWTDAYRDRPGPDVRDQRAELAVTLQW